MRGFTYGLLEHSIVCGSLSPSSFTRRQLASGSFEQIFWFPYSPLRSHSRLNNSNSAHRITLAARELHDKKPIYGNKEFSNPTNVPSSASSPDLSRVGVFCLTI